MKNDEDLRAVMCNIARGMNVSLNTNDIDVIHRLPVRRGLTPKIVVGPLALFEIRF